MVGYKTAKKDSIRSALNGLNKLNRKQRKLISKAKFERATSQEIMGDKNAN